MAVTFQIGIRKRIYFRKARLSVMRLFTIYFYYSGFFQIQIWFAFSTKKLLMLFLLSVLFLSRFFSLAIFSLDLLAVSGVDTSVNVCKNEPIIKLSGRGKNCGWIRLSRFRQACYFLGWWQVNSNFTRDFKSTLN